MIAFGNGGWEGILVVGETIAFDYHDKPRLGMIEKLGESKKDKSRFLILKLATPEVQEDGKVLEYKTFTVAKISKLERIMA